MGRREREREREDDSIIHGQIASHRHINKCCSTKQCLDENSELATLILSKLIMLHRAFILGSWSHRMNP